MIRDKKQLEDAITTNTKEIMRLKLMQVQHYKSIETTDFDDDMKYEFAELSPFKGDNMYIGFFFEEIRANQDFLYQILVNLDFFEDYKSMAIFVSDFFYENIFSQKTIDNELLFMLYRTLENEIKTLKNPNKPYLFLNNSINYFLIKKLIQKDDVQEYFRLIIKNIAEEVDSEKYEHFFSFESNILKALLKEKKNRKKYEEKDSKDNDFKKANANRDSIFEAQTKKKEDIPEEMKDSEFFVTYIPDCDRKALENAKEKINDPNMKSYIDKQLQMIQSAGNDFLFANKLFLNELYSEEEPTDLLEVYKSNFTIVIRILDKIINQLRSNIEIVPESLKYICKIITILIQKKFPDITKSQLNGFISRFFFELLMGTMLSKPNYFKILNTYHITTTTQSNLDLIFYFLKTLMSGEFIIATQNKNVTLFNWYFLKKMPEVFSIFDKLIDVELPSLIKQFDDPTFNPSSFVYDFRKEEPTAIIKGQSFLYSIEQLLLMMKSIQSKKEIFESNPNSKKLLLVLSYLFQAERYAKFEKEIARQKLSGVIQFYLIENLNKSDKVKEIWEYETPPYSYKEPKKVESLKEKLNLYLIKVKNSLCKILYNFIEIPDNTLFGFKVDNTDDFLKALLQLIKFKSINMDINLDSEWHSLTLNSFINRIDPFYKQNDFAKLYDELQTEIQNSINNINFDLMSKLEGSLRYLITKVSQLNRNIMHFDNVVSTYLALEFIKKAKVEVYLKSIYNEETEEEEFFIVTQKEIDNYNNSNYTSITPKTKALYDTVIYEGNKGKCTTIEEFVTKFPDFVGNLQSVEEDILEYERVNNFNKKIDGYFKEVEATLNKYSLVTSTDVDLKLKRSFTMRSAPASKDNDKIFQKVVNYIMNRIYVKLYPRDPDPSDIRTYKNCVKLDWIEPNHLCKSKQKLNLGDILPSTIRLIKQLDSEKSPNSKVELIETVMNVLKSTMNFYFSGAEGSVDDQIPLLSYIIIKASPYRLSSNLRYIELYYPSVSTCQAICVFTSVLQFVKDIDYSKLNNEDLTEDEYKNLCQKAISGELYK